MKAKELKYYKPLDITQLSGSPWNDAEKVLGLDQDDKVIMAEPEETVTPEYVDEAIAEATENLPTKNWVVGHCDLAISAATADLASNEYVDDAINQAVEAETARTEDTYAKKSEVPDLDDYYTKEEVDEAISGITVDLSDYYTKDETDQAISAATQDLASTDYVDDAIANETARTESTYLKQSAIEDDQFPTKNWVKGHTALAIEHSMEEETARTENTYAKIADIPSLDGYATEQYVDDAIAAIPAVDLSPYAKTTAVTEDINTAMAAETARTESTYLKEHQSLDNYYTKSEVDADFVSAATAVGQAIDAAVQGLASEDYVNNAVSGLASEDYVDNAVTSATEGLASEGYVDAAITSATQNLATEQYVDDAIAAIPEPDLSDYYTKEEVDAEITGATEDMATKTWVGQQGYLTQHQDLSAYAKTTAVTEDIASAMAAETARTENTYAKPSQIPSLAGYATEQYVDDAIASETARTESTYLKEHQDISGKLDKTDFDTYTGATETALAEKLDASAYTVDNAIDSASTNPVENRVIYDALNGTSATTELQVLDTDSTWMMKRDSTEPVPLKNTSIDNLKAIYLGDLVPSSFTVTNIWFVNDSVEYKLEVGQGEYGDGQVTIRDVGDTMFLFATGSTATDRLAIRKSLMDGTYEYYLLFDTEKLGCVVYKNLPTGITEVSDHSANISDLPTAQDGSNFKQYVYNGGSNDYKRVVSYVELEKITTGVSNKNLVLAALRPKMAGWNNSGNKNGTTITLPAGSEAATGVKTQRDSTIINRAEEALSGMTEQVTLTIGSTTTGSQYRIYVNNSAKNLYTTNDPRYYVYNLAMVSSGSDGNWTLARITIEGTVHRISNPAGASGSTINADGKYQLFPYNATQLDTMYVASATTKYAIVDVELKTLEITDSLTITRAKNIPQAISAATQGMVTSGDVATQIDTAMASETARTESTYAKPSQIPSLTGYATETWVQNQGYLTQHQSLAEYYTKTEIDGMIGDIESLLASI